MLLLQSIDSLFLVTQKNYSLVKYLYNTLLLSLIFVACACSKYTEAEPAISYLVKTKTTASSTETYTYDSLNRLTKISYSNDASFYTLEYDADTLINYHHAPNGSIYIASKYQLNHSKLIALLLPPHPDIIIDETESYAYDSQLFLKYFAWSVTDGTVLDTFYNNNTDVTYKKSYSSGLASSLYYTTQYEYYPTENTIGNNNFGKQYLGKSPVHLIKKETITYSPDPVTSASSVTNYTYEFDNYGRVIMQSAQKDTLPSVRTTFTYY